MKIFIVIAALVISSTALPKEEPVQVVEPAATQVEPKEPDPLPTKVLAEAPAIVEEAKIVPKEVKPVVKATPVSGSCTDWMIQAGVTDMVNAAELIRRESGCRVNADNPSSSAYGIPQALPGSKMASEGADWATNPVTQIRWMQKYVTSRYGSWAAAVAFHDRNNWY